MSLTVETVNTLASTLAAVPSVDAWEWLGNTGISADTAGKKVGGAVTTLVVLIAAWKTKGAIAGILAAGLWAVIFIYLLNNANSTDLQKIVKETVKGAPAVVRVVDPGSWA